MNKESAINEMTKSTTIGAFLVLVLSISGRPVGRGCSFLEICLAAFPFNCNINSPLLLKDAGMGLPGIRKWIYHENGSSNGGKRII